MFVYEITKDQNEMMEHNGSRKAPHNTHTHPHSNVIIAFHCNIYRILMRHTFGVIRKSNLVSLPRELFLYQLRCNLFVIHLLLLPLVPHYAHVRPPKKLRFCLRFFFSSIHYLRNVIAFRCYCCDTIDRILLLFCCLPLVVGAFTMMVIGKLVAQRVS